MSQQPARSPSDQSVSDQLTEPFLDEFLDESPPTPRCTAPLTAPQEALPSTSFTLSLEIPPPDRDLDYSFSNLSLETCVSNLASRNQSTLLISSQSIAVASSSWPHADSMISSRTAVQTWSSTSVSSLDTSSVPLSGIDSVTWTDTVSTNFPDDSLVAWASSASFSSQSQYCENIASMVRPCASSTRHSAVVTTAHPPRRASLYRPSFVSSGGAATPSANRAESCTTASRSGAISTPWPVSAVIPAMRADATAPSGASPTPWLNSLSASASAPEPQPVDPVMGRSYPPQPLQLSSPTFSDFTLPSTMTSAATATEDRIVDRLARIDARRAQRNCPYSRLTADSRVIYRSRRIPLVWESEPATSWTVDFSAAMPSSASASASPANQPLPSLAEDMARVERLVQERNRLQQLRQTLRSLRLQLMQMRVSPRSMGVRFSRTHSMLLAHRLNELQLAVSRQAEVVSRLQQHPSISIAQLLMMESANSQQRRGGQSGG